MAQPPYIFAELLNFYFYPKTMLNIYSTVFASLKTLNMTTQLNSQDSTAHPKQKLHHYQVSARVYKPYCSVL